MIAQALQAVAARIRARQGNPEIAHQPAPVTLPAPIPPRPQFADLEQTARLQAKRRALDIKGEARRIAAQLVVATDGDDIRLNYARTVFIEALDYAIRDELRRDLADVSRKAGQ